MDWLSVHLGATSGSVVVKVWDREVRPWEALPEVRNCPVRLNPRSFSYWVTYLTPLCLNFLVYKMETIESVVSLWE